MKDPNNREIMARIYRLIEKYETPPKTIYVDDGVKYFTDVSKDVSAIYDMFAGNEFAEELLIAFYSATEQRFKKANPGLLKDRPKAPDQLSMF